MMMVVVAMMMQRPGFEAGYLVSYSFRVADPGFKSRPLHLFSYSSGFCSLTQTRLLLPFVVAHFCLLVARKN
jgi:hypothetical protein